MDAESRQLTVASGWYKLPTVIAFTKAMRCPGRLVVCTVFLFPLAVFCRPTSEGVYTKQQAARGQALYAEECAKCHGENLSGGDDSPELAGASFMARWKGKKLSALFTLISKTMPTDDPGHLNTRQTADVSAFILSSNGFPAGLDELPNNSAALDDITIEARK